jgi:hypothetical protein
MARGPDENDREAEIHYQGDWPPARDDVNGDEQGEAEDDQLRLKFEAWLAAHPEERHGWRL